MAPIAPKWVRVQYICFMLLAVPNLAFSQLSASLCTSDSTLLRFAWNPQPAFYAPGNLGLTTFNASYPRNPGKLLYGENIASKAILLELDHSDYQFHPYSQNAESTSPAEYWRRLRVQLAACADVGILPDCRITPPLLTGLRRGKHSFSEFAARLDLAIADSAIPIISIDLPDAEAIPARDALRSNCPKALVGRVFHSLPSQQRNGPCGYDFAVVHAEAIPETFRIQAAINYCHSRLGPIPVIIATSRPHFYHNLIWTACGAAGIQYAPLPTAPAHLRTTAWHNLRAVFGLLPRLTQSIRLAPELKCDGIVAAFSMGEAGFCLIVAPKNPFLFDVPAASPNSDMLATWYNPETDQNIVIPRTPWPSSYQVTAPSQQPWIFFARAVPRTEDSQTTVTPILPEPPEPAWDLLDTLTTETLTTNSTATQSR